MEKKQSASTTAKPSTKKASKARKHAKYMVTKDVADPGLAINTTKSAVEALFNAARDASSNAITDANNINEKFGLEKTVETVAANNQANKATKSDLCASIVGPWPPRKEG